jgi:hypothetical protein
MTDQNTTPVINVGNTSHVASIGNTATVTSVGNTADVTSVGNTADVTSVGNTADVTSVGGFIATNTVIDPTTDATLNVTKLSTTDIDKVINAWSADIDKAKHADGYTPVFNNTVRTIIYIIALVASVAGLGLMSFGHADIGGFISTAAGIIAGGFGVAYNPLRQN